MSGEGQSEKHGVKIENFQQYRRFKRTAMHAVDSVGLRLEPLCSGTNLCNFLEQGMLSPARQAIPRLMFVYYQGSHERKQARAISTYPRTHRGPVIPFVLNNNPLSWTVVAEFLAFIIFSNGVRETTMAGVRGKVWEACLDFACLG